LPIRHSGLELLYLTGRDGWRADPTGLAFLLGQIFHIDPP
jgi:hypothetical protein